MLTIGFVPPISDGCAISISKFTVVFWRWQFGRVIYGSVKKTGQKKDGGGLCVIEIPTHNPNWKEERKKELWPQKKQITFNEWEKESALWSACCWPTSLCWLRRFAMLTCRVPIGSLSRWKNQIYFISGIETVIKLNLRKRNSEIKRLLKAWILKEIVTDFPDDN